MNKQIEIVVDPKGAATVETKGFTGSSCIEASRFIEQALGNKTGERTTPEFYWQTPTGVQQEQQSG